MVEPSFAARSVIYHKDYLTNGRLLVSKVINISKSEVLTEEGHQVAYDYLVIATGHNDTFPKTRTERLKEYYAGIPISSWNSSFYFVYYIQPSVFSWFAWILLSRVFQFAT